MLSPLGEDPCTTGAFFAMLMEGVWTTGAVMATFSGSAEAGDLFSGLEKTPMYLARAPKAALEKALPVGAGLAPSARSTA